MEAASQVLVRVGYDRANTSVIAEAAGVSVGTLYQYFPNKDSVLSRLLQNELEGAVEHMLRALAESTDTGIEPKLRAALGALLRYKGAKPRLHRVLKTELGRLEGQPLLKRLNERSLLMTEQLLRAHQAELRLADPARAAFLLVNAVDGVIAAILYDDPAALLAPGLLSELTGLGMALLKALPRES